MSKRKLLICADSAVSTGFAQVSHNLIHNLKDRWEIDVLAINYYGDPHDILKEARHWNPSVMMPGDYYGLYRISPLSQQLKSDIVLFINDPAVLADYVPLFDKIHGKKVGYTPVDARHIKNMYGERLNSFDYIISYTGFGKQELSYSGVITPIDIVPHGVDTELFRPINKQEARALANIPQDWYIVQMVDRNSQRKRIDLGLYYFAEWVRTHVLPDNVHFYYHGALKDQGWDIIDLAKYLDEYYLRTYNWTPGIHKRLVVTSHHLAPSVGIDIEKMVYLYNIADVKLSMAFEGWGLTTAESMACSVPNIVPRYSALGEWADGGVEYTDISEIPLFGTSGLNTWGIQPDMQSTIKALDILYRDHAYRHTLGKKGYDLITQDKFKWSNIADQFHAIFEGLLSSESTIE